MIPFKERVAIRQYIPRKPHSTGIKYWTLVDDHGYMYYFQIYVGKKTKKGGVKASWWKTIGINST